MALTTSTKTLKTDKNSQQIRQKQSYIDATMSKFNEKNSFQNLSFFYNFKTIGPPIDFENKCRSASLLAYLIIFRFKEANAGNSYHIFITF